MNIIKELDFVGNLKLELSIKESLSGNLSSNKERLQISLNLSEESIENFLDKFGKNIKIKINGKFLNLVPSKDNKSFTANIPKSIEEIEIFASDKLLANYKINDKKELVLEKENLIDSYFIKNSILNNDINFNDIVESKYKIKTDLHTHYAGAPTARGLIDLGLKKDFQYPTLLLAQAGIDVNTDSKTVSLRSLSKNDLNLLEKQMQISVGEQIRFSNEEQNLEKIYSFRQPFFRDYSLTPQLLELIAQEYSKKGVSYVELSGSQIFDLEKDPQMLRLATETIPQLEEKYGIKLRFLGAMTRYDDVEWSLDQLEKLKVVANNPYIAGLDIVGHETNSTLDVADNIEPYMKFSKENNLDWTFRFHAGENPSHPENVKEALKLAEKHDVKIRIGHGLYGIDEETLDLAKRTNAIIEINSSSNLSLNNVTDVDEMQPLVNYLKNGINVVLGTDSPGIYQTDSQQELSIAQRILLHNNVSTDLIEKIISVENNVIAQRVKKEDELKKRTNSTYIPPSYFFKDLSNNWTPEITQEKNKIREEKVTNAIEKINGLGADYVDAENINKYLKDINKIPFVISGASKSNWKSLTETEKDKIKDEMNNLLNKLDPDKYIIVTGGTDYGVEEIIHNNAKNKGFSVMGVLTEEADLSEIKNPNISCYTLAKGNWWAKSSFVMDKIIKPCQGKVLFVAGGPIVGDEILSSLYHKLGKDQLFLMTGVGGSSEKKAKQNNDFAVSQSDEIISKINKSEKENVVSKINKLRNNSEKRLNKKLTA